MRRRSVSQESKPSVVRVDDRIRESARTILPFKLTDGQRTALKAIVDDMQLPAPINRLLQGDVGAGKTIVALLAALVAMENGLQVAFMAPTEILAEQHYLSLRKLLEKSRFHVELLTGTTAGLKRRDLLAPLGDVIPIPPPAGVVLSIGDVLLYAGMAWFVFQVMRGRSRETPRPIAMWFLAYRGKHAPGHWRMAARYRAAAPVGAERSGTEP